MPAKKKTATKTKVKMKDLKAKKNPKGGLINQTYQKNLGRAAQGSD